MRTAFRRSFNMHAWNMHATRQQRRALAYISFVHIGPFIPLVYLRACVCKRIRIMLYLRTCVHLDRVHFILYFAAISTLLVLLLLPNADAVTIQLSAIGASSCLCINANMKSCINFKCVTNRKWLALFLCGYLSRLLRQSKPSTSRANSFIQSSPGQNRGDQNGQVYLCNI